MTKFSPAAQAVLIACNTAIERLPLTAKPEQFSIALIAATLRAAADHLDYINSLYEVAAELEGHV